MTDRLSDERIAEIRAQAEAQAEAKSKRAAANGHDPGHGIPPTPEPAPDDDLGPEEPPADAGDESPSETLGVDRPLFPPPTAPLNVARKLYSRYRIGGNGLRILVAYRGGFMRWETTHWSELDAAELRSETYDALGEVDYKHPIREKGVIVDYEIRPWSPDKYKVANVIEAMAAIGHLSADIDPPSWIDFRSVHSAAHDDDVPQLISCTNGLLDVSSRTLHPHTPAWFNVVSVPFAYDPDPGEPVAWLEFLESVWGDDAESIALLQEYIGYLLSGRTHMQKMLLLAGPTRSGKGTVGRLLKKLLGRGHVTGPTLASLGTNFGMSPLLGKPLAIVSDARLGRESSVVVERLLSITGEDTLTVDRKFRESWTGKLPTRFVILTNELPRFRDASGAIANRMLVLQLTESYLGREDHELDAKIADELPGVLSWALEGLDRLLRNDRFTEPSSSTDAVTLMMDLASPVSAFVRECCVREPDASIAVDDLYAAWKDWAEDNGHRAGAKSTFGRDLRAVAPELKLSQPVIDGKRVRCHGGIRLRNAYSGEMPVHPVPGHETAGQDTFGWHGHPVPVPVPDVPAGDDHEVARDHPVPGDRQNSRSETVARDARAKTHSRSNSGSETGNLFTDQSPSTNDEGRHCGCGNALLTPDAINSGKCKPCRDKLTARYES